MLKIKTDRESGRNETVGLFICLVYMDLYDFGGYSWKNLQEGRIEK